MDVHQPQKLTDGCGAANRDIRPTDVHPMVKEEAVERFELEELGFGDVRRYE